MRGEYCGAIAVQSSRLWSFIGRDVNTFAIITSALSVSLYQRTSSHSHSSNTFSHQP